MRGRKRPEISLVSLQGLVEHSASLRSSDSSLTVPSWGTRAWISQLLQAQRPPRWGMQAGPQAPTEHRGHILLCEAAPSHSSPTPTSPRPTHSPDPGQHESHGLPDTGRQDQGLGYLGSLPPLSPVGCVSWSHSPQWGVYLCGTHPLPFSSSWNSFSRTSGGVMGPGGPWGPGGPGGPGRPS